MDNRLFFELVQVGIGNRNRISATPSAKEWDELFRMARIQALLGVCFAGLKSLERQGQLTYLPVQLKMEWMTIAAKIQKQNEVVNLRCAELSKKLSEDGFGNCLLKGQGFARLYDVLPHPLNDNMQEESHNPLRKEFGESLSLLRQSGDIDMWMMAEPKVAIGWAKNTGRMNNFDYHHADVRLFPDVEVELHYRPSISRNLVRNARMQRWFKESGKEHIVYDKPLDCYVPDWTFNVVLCLNHIFCHLMFEGVGLRQLMDFYFVLRANPQSNNDRNEVLELLRRFHLMNFASAVMWVQEYVFGLEREYMLCEPDEKAGRFLLDEILRAGNFGHYDERLKGARAGSRTRLFARWLKHSMRLLKYYPIDVLWTPIGILWISMWRRVRRHY